MNSPKMPAALHKQLLRLKQDPDEWVLHGRAPHKDHDVAIGDVVLWENELWNVSSIACRAEDPQVTAGSLPAALMVARKDIEDAVVNFRTKVVALRELKVVIDAEWWVHPQNPAARRILA